MRHDCPLRAEDLGPYLLGALGAEDARRVAALLRDCPTCTDEVERLRPVVAALGRAPVGAAASAEDAAGSTHPAPAGLDRVLLSVARERTHRRRRTLTRVGLAAAAVALVSAGVVGVLGRDGGGGREVDLAGGPGVAGTAVVTERGWGTAVSLEVSGLRPGATYGAWLGDTSGERSPAGTFRATPDGSVRVELGTALRLGSARVLGVTLLGGPDVLTADLSG